VADICILMVQCNQMNYETTSAIYGIEILSVHVTWQLCYESLHFPWQMTLEFVSCIVVNAVVDIADSFVLSEIYIIVTEWPD